MSPTPASMTPSAIQRTCRRAHVTMTDRRFNKLKLLEDTPYEKRNEENDVVIMPWGGQKGPGA